MDQIDNITFAIVSLKEVIEAYLDSQGWKNKYSMYVSGDPALKGKEISLSPGRNKVVLPLIILRSGFTRNQIEQLGDEYGRDVVSLSLHIMAVDSIQLLTLGNLLRRKLERFTFNVLNYKNSLKSSIGLGETYRAELVDISDPNSDRIQDQNSSLLNVTLELNSESFI